MFPHYYRCACRSMQPLSQVDCPKRQEFMTPRRVTVTGLDERRRLGRDRGQGTRVASDKTRALCA